MTSIVSSRRPDVTFHQSGRIDISSYVARQLDIQPGDVINVAKDGREYYLYIKHRQSRANHAGKVFAVNRNTRMLRAWSVQLARAMLEAAAATDIARLAVGDVTEIDSNKYLPIIYRRTL